MYYRYTINYIDELDYETTIRSGIVCANSYTEAIDYLRDYYVKDEDGIEKVTLENLGDYGMVLDLPENTIDAVVNALQRED